jgi:hypothetical protein
MYKLTGELKAIGDTQQISDSFKKREFVVIDSSSQYAQTILFQAVQDRTDLLNNFKEGDTVQVTFFLRGREWTSPKDGQVKYFNSLDAWKIEPVENMGSKDNANTNHETFVPSDEDGLPF